MALLLKRRADEVKIIDKVVKAAAGNGSSGKAFPQAAGGRG